MEISKELASSVLGLNVAYTERCEHRDNIIGIWANMNTKPIKEINIYEFIYKNCIHWAFNHGYNLAVLEDIKTEKFGVLSDSFLVGFNFSEDVEKQKTREEAILLACEYILNNIKQ